MRWLERTAAFEPCRVSRSGPCCASGILPRTARRVIESSEKLGRYRWVVERAHARLNSFRRLRIRYERRDAFITLGEDLVIRQPDQTVLLEPLGSK